MGRPPPGGVRVTLDALVAEIEEQAAAYLASRPDSTLSVGVSVDGERTVRYFRADGAQHALVPDASSIYEIGSVSKTFMATVLAALEARGVLGLDDPISKHLPSSTRLAPEIAAITVRQLATHSSGLPDTGDEHLKIQASEGRGELPPWGFYTQYLRYRTEHLLSDLETATLQYPTDQGNSYSVLGIGALGLIMELASGRGYEDLLHEVVTGPLGLADTGYRSLTPEQEQRIVWAYDASGAPDPNWHWDVMLPQGGLRSTIADLLSYGEANIAASRNPGDTSEVSVAMRRAREIHWTAPDGYTMPGTDVPFPYVQGLMWMGFRSPVPDRRNWWHPGTTQFYNAGLGVVPELGLTLTAASSAHSGIGDPGEHLPMVLGWFMRAAAALSA